LISNFFNNLTKENVIKNNLPTGKISTIKKHYSDVIKKSHLALKGSFELTDELNKDYYQWFRSNLLATYPEFVSILDEIENILDMKLLERYLVKGVDRISKSYNYKNDLETQVGTAVIENFIQNGKIPSSKNDFKLIQKVITQSIDELANLGLKFLGENKAKTLEDLHRDKIRFESKLYKLWKEPLDILELLINSSMELGETVKNQLAKGKLKISNPKHVALIKIHARGIQIANEIFSLLKSGYADGANGRWRTLYELTAIFLILKNNPDSLSEKYLEYQAVKAFKEVQDFEDYHSKLGYRSVPKKAIQDIKNEYARLKSTYGKDIIKKDYGWIPKSILPDCNFKGLTKKVSIDHYLPIYNTSLNAAHGGARGFYRMSLPSKSQSAVLLAGPSIYGLADPIQNTAYCLRLMDVVLLSVDFNYENAYLSKMLTGHFANIGETAVKVHKKIEAKMKN
jgi:hypothetical protein